MGKKLDALMGKRFRSSGSQLKPLLNLALSRLVVLKSQRQARCNISRSDVVKLLSLASYHDRALLRVEQVIKEENMMDVYVMVEGYCLVILERIHLIEQHEIRECPEEVNEAVSCLIYAASRCGEFPELQEIRDIFTHRFGKEFAARAIELRNNCSVTRRMILKLSPRQPDLESRLKKLNEIAAENNIVLHIQDQEKEQVAISDQNYNNNHNPPTTEETKPPRRHNLEEESTDSIKTERRQYKNVADAAQAAFESAAFAASAARAAVELSKSQSQHRRGDVTESQDMIHRQYKDEEEEEEETVETTTSKEQDDDEREDEGLGKNRSKKKDGSLERTSSSEVKLKQSSSDPSENQTAPFAKPEIKRFFEWTMRKLRRSRAGE